ncbi:I66 family serine proteinase inhibitor [Streptomyces rubellomurinus]|uniref:Uncharacterized protein n=2 Tax=Streptomyces TaxID=1883 RepID=A0A0F2TN41_STRR3|nr:I66 family serine proteinase inhibitor [Streptomyces rubellomurinus]KJS56477.1 hypothetical protein VM98_06595 [Streptomyces rubellomurinus subsp. indigoferus]KJS63710.1 hypothetical protein VM95_00010 [Streptomyces rubellomurinus]
MDQLNGLFKLYIGGAPLSVVDDKLVALLGEHDQRLAVIWRIQPAKLNGPDAFVISTENESSGWVNPKPGAREQIEIRPLIALDSLPPTFPTEEVFRLKPLYGEGPEGAFTVRSAADDGLVGRRLAEDKSLLPKAVFSDTDDRDAFVVAVPVGS